MNADPTIPTKAELAVVIATDRYETIRPVVSCLRRQGDPGRLELVLVAPHGGLADADERELGEFGAVRRVGVESVESLPAARAAGVWASTAPWVFIGETHSYPRPGWADATLLAHASARRAVVVPSIGNADRRGAASRAGYALDYARWGPWRAAGEMDDPLIYNATYRREILVGFGDRLATALDPRSELLWPELRARGEKAWFEPSARVDHLSVGKWWDNLRERFLVGLVLAGRRNAGWSPARRAAYFLAGPLIACLLLKRELPALAGAPAGERLGRGLVPLMFVGCCAKAAGEMLGYACGTPRWVQPLETEIEIHRLRFCPRPPA